MLDESTEDLSTLNGRAERTVVVGFAWSSMSMMPMTTMSLRSHIDSGTSTQAFADAIHLVDGMVKACRSFSVLSVLSWRPTLLNLPVSRISSWTRTKRPSGLELAHYRCRIWLGRAGTWWWRNNDIMTVRSSWMAVNVVMKTFSIREWHSNGRDHAESSPYECTTIEHCWRHRRRWTTACFAMLSCYSRSWRNEMPVMLLFLLKLDCSLSAEG